MSLNSAELSGPVSRSQGMSGKPSNDGWKLDKWKFLPMMRKTLELHPDQKWYIFVEMDTYILWQTLLVYLFDMDWTKPYYLGSQMQIGDVVFAHGGSGYVVSRPTLEMVVRHYVEQNREWEDFTENHWAGDCVLGKAFSDAGVSLSWVWPIFQGDDVGNMNYSVTSWDRRLWCHPSVSYHHLSPFAVGDLWEFEQNWLSSNEKVVNPNLILKIGLTSLHRTPRASYGTRTYTKSMSFRTSHM